MNSISLNLQNVTDDMSDWDAHWTAFSNVVQIYEAYKSNAITPRTKQLISAESFADVIDNFAHYVKEFFNWLWEKIKSAFDAIRRFIQRIIWRIKIFLFGSAKPKSRSDIIKMCTMQRQIFAELNMKPKYLYDIDRFVDVYETASDTLVPKYTEENYTFDTIKAAVADIRKAYTSVTEELHNICKVKITSPELIDALDHSLNKLVIPELLPDQLAIVDQACRQVESDLNKIKAKTINETNVYSELMNFAKTICNDCRNVITVSFTNNNVNSITTARSLIDCANVVLTCVRIISSEGAKWLAIYEKLLMQVYNIYNIKGSAINLQVQLPDDMLAHLQEMYGGTIEVGKIYITNTNMSFWDVGGGDDYAYVYGKARGHANVTHKCITVRVNAKIFLASDKTRESERKNYIHLYGLNSSFSEREQLLLSFIVHEYSHAFDSQHNRDLMMVGDTSEPVPSEVPSGYWHNASEQRARHMQQHYTPTTTELAWAKQVISQLDAEFQKMPKLHTFDVPDF